MSLDLILQAPKGGGVSSKKTTLIFEPYFKLQYLNKYLSNIIDIFRINVTFLVLLKKTGKLFMSDVF